MLKDLWFGRQQPSKASRGAFACTVAVFAATAALSLPARSDAVPTVAQTPQPDKNDADPKVTAIPEAVSKKFKLDTTFYKKHLDYKGFSILSSAKVSDAALLEARYLIDKLLGEREDILKAMIKRGCRFMVMAPDGDDDRRARAAAPEERPKTNWDTRARGLGGKLSSCGEENLLNLKGDRYKQENILIHEFNHAIHQHGLKEVDPTFDGRLREDVQEGDGQGAVEGHLRGDQSQRILGGRGPGLFRLHAAAVRRQHAREAAKVRSRTCSPWWTRSTSNRSSAMFATTNAMHRGSRGMTKRRRLALAPRPLVRSQTPVWERPSSKLLFGRSAIHHSR